MEQFRNFGYSTRVCELYLGFGKWELGIWDWDMGLVNLGIYEFREKGNEGKWSEGVEG